VNWSPRFVDTGYWIAVFNVRDALHPRARTLAQSVRGPLVTTAAILLEVADGLNRASTRHLGGLFLETVRADPRVEIVALTDDLLERAVQLYKARPDKEWGLTDCISFVVMEARGITEALAADQHVLQAGFRALLREP
jgi:predicted nucleic acid-binding protein